jgi:hypothetical protein
MCGRYEITVLAVEYHTVCLDLEFPLRCHGCLSLR